MSDANDTINTAALAQIAGIKGQLDGITQMILSNHNATHQRIDDLRHAIEGRLTGVESRVGKLETNERGTAIRTGATGALSGALSAALVAAAIAAVRGH